MKRSGMSCPTLRGKCPIFNFFITCFIMEPLNFTTSESTPKGVIGKYYWNVTKVAIIKDLLIDQYFNRVKNYIFIFL